MKTTQLSEILKRLLFDRNMKIIDLARATGLPQQTVQRIVAGNCMRPHSNTLEPIAKFFNISPSQLKGEAPINWESSRIDPLKELGIRQVPLINWIDIEKLASEKNEFLVSNETSKIVTQVHVSAEAFALKIKDASMEPIFPVDSIIIIDPNKPHRDRSYVVVKIEQYQEPILRYLILDGGDKFVKPISPDLENFSIHMINNCDTIYGTLVEAKQLY